MSAPTPVHSVKIDAIRRMAYIGQHRQPESEQNEGETDEVEQTTNVDSFNEMKKSAALLLPESRFCGSNRPSTPSSASHAASHSSSRYSPTSSASRSPSTYSSESPLSLRLTPPSALTFEPLPPPSSSAMRQRRKSKLNSQQILFPTINHHTASSTDYTESIDSSDNYSDSNDSNVILARFVANEQYQYQRDRLRHLFQQHQHKEDDASSTANNIEQRHGHEVEHEIAIHPKSVEGTLESASFHLHGQSGGRMKSSNPEVKNAAVMDRYVLRHVIDTKESLSEMLEDTLETNIKIDLENGVNVISNRGGRKSSKRHLMIDDDNHEDLWSTGVAAAVVMGTAARYHKTFCMFPHGRKVILPIIIGTLALCLSIVTLKSCRFLTVLLRSNEVFQLGPWSYSSPGEVYNGEACLSYPSAMEFDTPFMVARMVSALATCLGGGLLLMTTTMMCVPYDKPGIRFLGVGYISAGILQALTMVFYQTNNCKGRGYFGGFQCKPNQDLVLCLAASLLYLACGWIFYMLQNLVVAPPGHSASQIYTCSAKSSSSDERKGILRTVEKSWTKIPSGEILVATVLVERREGSDGKVKTVHSIQTELIDEQ